MSDDERREPGSWIGQQEDRNTQQVREGLPAGAERVAVTNNEPETTGEPDPTSVEKPASTAPDEGKAYDPAMTDEDEANIPADSEADPNASGQAG
jgi:hypothetical protein